MSQPLNVTDFSPTWKPARRSVNAVARSDVPKSDPTQRPRKRLTEMFASAAAERERLLGLLERITARLVAIFRPNRP